MAIRVWIIGLREKHIDFTSLDSFLRILLNYLGPKIFESQDMVRNINCARC